MPPQTRDQLLALCEAQQEYRKHGWHGKFTPLQRRLLQDYMKAIGEKK